MDIRRSFRFISKMGFHILVRRHLYIESMPTAHNDIFSNSAPNKIIASFNTQLIMISFWALAYLLWFSSRLISVHIIQGYFLGTGQSHQHHITVTSHERHVVSNHQHLDCVLNCLFKLISKKIPKTRVTGLSEGNTPVTSGVPSQRASNVKNVPN